MSENLKLRETSDVMPVGTARLFAEIRDNSLLDCFILIGGTALALHIGHRLSEDLDFMTLHPKLPRAALSELEKELIKNGHSITHQVDMKAYDDFQISGLDLADNQQDWLVDGNVKLTFFCAGPQHSKLMMDSQLDQATHHGFKIASFDELCRLKATVTASRSKSRDWLDLFILQRDHKFGIAGWKAAFDQSGLTSMHFEIALKRMCEGQLSEGDEGFSALLANAPSVAEMQETFRILRGEYERGLAKLKLS